MQKYLVKNFDEILDIALLLIQITLNQYRPINAYS